MRATGNGADWNDEIVGRLRRLWNDGHSTAEIGRRLGVSKNAVIGKRHRLELPARPSPIKRCGTSGPRPLTVPRIVPKLADIMPLNTGAVPVAAQMPSIGLSTASIKHTGSDPLQPMPSGNQPCCWPIGDPGTPGFRFCDDNTLIGKPYCEDHARTAYRPFRRSHETGPSAAPAE
jgi:GcrA cell cycle regulator